MISELGRRAKGRPLELVISNREALELARDWVEHWPKEDLNSVYKIILEGKAVAFGIPVRVSTLPE